MSELEGYTAADKTEEQKYDRKIAAHLLPLGMEPASMLLCPYCRKTTLLPIPDVRTGLILPGERMTFNAQPQDVFKPVKLLFSVDDPEGLYIEDIKIGNISQISSNAAIAVQPFIDKRTTPELTIDCAQVSQLISVRVINRSSDSKRCEITLLGFVARQ